MIFKILFANIKQVAVLLLLAACLSQLSCSSFANDKNDNPDMKDPMAELTNDVDFWLTKGDQSVLLEKQSGILGFSTSHNNYPTIEIDKNVSFQEIEGFGYTLTSGSADVINGLSPSKKKELLQELFGKSENDISLSYVRISIGASDLSASTYTYNDLGKNEIDLTLQNFSLDPDREGVITLLLDILEINPDVKILATPWTAPTWMKDNKSFVGGHLLPEYYQVYADYFVKYIQEMKVEGIVVHAITPQNEPLHGGNNPSMEMTAVEQADFIKNNLGPTFEANEIETEILIYDHNCDQPEYPLAILNDADAKAYVAGSAFHLYGGDISALSQVHNAHPDKGVYFTEQYTASDGEFAGDLKWHLKNVIIGSLRNWSKVALEWNLANDGSFGPHTDGGCTVCKGAINVNSSENFARNVAYYIVAHASKFVPSGSQRIKSTDHADLTNVAFKTPVGKKVLIVLNISEINQLFNIKVDGQWVATSLDGGAVGTYVWE